MPLLVGILIQNERSKSMCCTPEDAHMCRMRTGLNMLSCYDVFRYTRKFVNLRSNHSPRFRKMPHGAVGFFVPAV